MRIWVEINEVASQNKWGLKPRTNWGVAQNDLQLHSLKTHGFNEYKALVPQRDWAGRGKKEEKVKKREKAQEVFLWSWWPVSCPFFPLFIRNLCFWKDCFEGSFGWCSFRHLVTLLLEHPRLLTIWGHGRCSVKSNKAQFWALLRANYGSGRAPRQQQRFQIDCRRNQLSRGRVGMMIILFVICEFVSLWFVNLWLKIGRFALVTVQITWCRTDSYFTKLWQEQAVLSSTSNEFYLQHWKLIEKTALWWM